MTSFPDVIVIGAGVIGLAVARELARRGTSVTVVERGSPGREASWAAAGMLSPLGEVVALPDMRALADASLDLWPSFSRALREETSVDVEYRALGALHIAFDEAHAQLLRALESRADERSGAEWLEADAARRLEPAIADDVTAGLLIARDHRVNNRRLGQALWAAAVGAGVEFRLGAEVQQIMIAGPADGRRRFSRVRLANGGELAGGALVIAAGAWSGGLSGLPTPVPVRPIRGQMLAVTSAPERRAVLERVLVAPGCYMVPREDGQLLIGATVEDTGFRPGPTPAGIAALVSAAVRAAPIVQDLPISETWAGFRPGTPDDRPVLGVDPGADGVFHATGHFRNGILLTPITAQVIADTVQQKPTEFPITSFSAARFQS